MTFQSTRPLRASTLISYTAAPQYTFQSTRPLRASTSVSIYTAHTTAISIHKALTGLDVRPSFKNMHAGIFQSTRPLRASTAIFTNFFHIYFIFLDIMLHFLIQLPFPIQKTPIFNVTFLTFSSANILTFLCPLHIRTKKSTVLSHQIQALPLYAPPYFYIGFPDYKISGCLYLYQ